MRPPEIGRLYGLILPYPHGLLTLLGKKKRSLHAERVIKHLDEDILLIENEHALGVVRLSDEEVLSEEEAEERLEEFGLSEEEFKDWFKGRGTLYAYRITLVKPFLRPVRVEVPERAVLWVSPSRMTFAMLHELWDMFLHRNLPHPLRHPDASYRQAFLRFAEWLRGVDLPKGYEEDFMWVQSMATLLAAGLEELTPEYLDGLPISKLLELKELAELLPDGEEKDNIVANLLAALERRGIDMEREYLPTPSEKGEGGEAEAEDVLRLLTKPAILYERAVLLVGSLAQRGRGHDVDILVRKEIPKEVYRRIAFRVGRVLNKLGVKIHILYDDGPFTDYIPLYDVVLVPSKRTKVEMAKLEPFTVIETMKPIRIGQGQRQSLGSFLALVDQYGAEGYLEPKYDGVCVYAHHKDGEVRVWTEDGEEITDLVVDLFKELPKEAFIVAGELEAWRDGRKLPREWISGHLHARRAAEFTLTVFDLLYLGEPLTDVPFRERRRKLEKLADALGWKERTPTLKEKGVYLGNSYPVRSVEEIKRELKRILKHKEFEGVVWKKATGTYRMGKPPAEGAQIKWHRNVVVRGVVVARHETKTKGVYNYEWGLPCEDPQFGPLQEVRGKKVLVVGKTFSTNRVFEPGEEIVVELETLTLEKRGNVFRIGGWAPKILKDEEEVK